MAMRMPFYNHGNLIALNEMPQLARLSASARAVLSSFRDDLAYLGLRLFTSTFRTCLRSRDCPLCTTQTGSDWTPDTTYIEQQWTTVVMVDVVGYSDLIQDDDLGTALRVIFLRKRLLEPIAVAHGGRVVDSVGDGALLAFPRATSALDCAIEIRRELSAIQQYIPTDRCLRLRVGLSAGRLFVIDNSLYGCAVIIAARLMQSADPNEILFCETVFNHLNHRLVTWTQSLGTRYLKNIRSSIQVFRVNDSQVLNANTFRAGPEPRCKY
jgi:class 3 adenylate cyclase